MARLKHLTDRVETLSQVDRKIAGLVGQEVVTLRTAPGL